MKMHSLDRLFLILFHEVYLLEYFISYYGILAKVCHFLHTLLQIFAKWVSKPTLLCKLISNRFLLLLFLMTSLSILIEKGSCVLKMRLDHLLLRNCLKTIQKVLFLLLLIFLEWRQHSQNTHTECHHLRNT